MKYSEYKEYPILSWSRETLLKDFSLLDNSDIVKKVFTKKWTKNSHVTVNDTFNTRGLNDDEIVKIIKSKIDVDIRTAEWIEKLNILFIDAVDFLHNTLYRNVWNEIKKNKLAFFSITPNKEWILWNDVIEFLRVSEKWIRVSQTHCRISKIIYWVNDILENPKITEAEKNAKEIVRERIAPWIQVQDFDMLMQYKQYNCTVVLNWKIIDFKLKFRWKKSSSALLKIIYFPEYSSSELIKDPVWMELVCKNQEEASILLNHFYTTLFEEKIEKVKNKNFDIWKILDNNNITPSFKTELWKMSEKKKATTNKWYMDLKILWKVNGCNIEFRASLEWNKEEDILKSDPVYYLWKILLTMIRLDWYITENYIRLVINEFFKDNPDMVEKLDKTHLLNYLLEPLIQIDRWNRCNIYTSKDRYETLSETDFYPDNFKELEKN